jgi:hypothetical protein
MVHTVTRVTINGFITVIAGLALAFCGPGRWQTLCRTPANRGQRGKSLFVEIISPGPILGCGDGRAGRPEPETC